MCTSTGRILVQVGQCQKCFYPEYKQYILWYLHSKTLRRNQKTSEITESSVLQNVWKAKILNHFFKLVHKPEVCLNKDVQKGQTSTGHHSHIINLKLRQLLKVHLLPHMQTELLPLYKWLYWGMGPFDCSSILVLPSCLKYDWWDEPKATNHHIPFRDLPQNPNSSSLLS